MGVPISDLTDEVMQLSTSELVSSLQQLSDWELTGVLEANTSVRKMIERSAAVSTGHFMVVGIIVAQALYREASRRWMSSLFTDR